MKVVNVLFLMLDRVVLQKALTSSLFLLLLLFFTIHPHSASLLTSTMSLNPTRMLLRNRLALRKNNWICPQCRAYAAAATAAGGMDSTSIPPSPLLSKLKTDMKAAMKAKDKTRLDVVRALLADITNSAKTSNPIKTDMQLLALIKKRSTAAKAASQEFEEAGRPELVDKEREQIEVLEQYASEVKTMSEDDIKNAVQTVVDEVKAAAQSAKVNMGDVLKKILGPGGSLEGKPVDRSEVARVVKQILGQ